MDTLNMAHQWKCRVAAGLQGVLAFWPSQQIPSIGFAMVSGACLALACVLDRPRLPLPAQSLADCCCGRKLSQRQDLY